MQGVTLEVIGNCGFGCSPIGDAGLAAHAIYGHSEAVPSPGERRPAISKELEAARPAINVLSLVPNGQLRLAVVGLEDRPATPTSCGRCAAAGGGPRAGRLGLLDRPRIRTGAGSDRGRADELCARPARRGGIFATHTGGATPDLHEAVEEAIRTARDAEGQLQVSHLIPRSDQEEARRCVAAVDARRRTSTSRSTCIRGCTARHSCMRPCRPAC